MRKAYLYIIIVIIMGIIITDLTLYKPYNGQYKDNQNNDAKSLIVSFSFDDNFKSHMIALGEMKKYGYKGTVGIIVGTLVSKQNNTLSIDDIKLLQQEGWEIASHTMSHKKLTDLNDTQIENELRESQTFFGQHDINATTIIYPFSEIDENVIRKSEKYYLLGRVGCLDNKDTNLIYSKQPSIDDIEKNCINADPKASNFKIKSIGINEKIYSSAWLTYILSNVSMINSTVWLNFHFHGIADNVTNDNLQLSDKNFKEILKIMNENNVTIRTIKDANIIYEQMN